MLASLLGCRQEKPVEPNADAVQQVLGSWKLVQPASNFALTLNVDVDQYSGGTASGIYALKLTGKAAVNSYFTSARLIDWSTGHIEVAEVGTTQLAGSAEAMQVELTYYTNLKAVSRYELTDKNRLRLYHSGGLLVYEK